MGIFEIHNLIANIVGRFYEIHERMARKAQRFVRCRATWEAQFVGDAPEIGCLALEETKLRLAAATIGGKRILDNRGQRSVGHYEAARSMAVELVRQESERIGIAIEVDNVRPDAFREHFLPFAALSLGKKAAYGALSAVAERRIAHIVGQTSGGDDRAEGFRCALSRCEISLL